jgi:flagellar basal body-associated protein FliL
MTRQKNIIIAAVIIIVILALGVIGFVTHKANTATNTIPNNILGGDRDEHGCIGSAGYSWCEKKNKCLRQWEEECESKKTSVEEIQKLFAEKYPKYAETITVNVEKEIEGYARGSVIFEIGAPGGYFLAMKTDDAWQIVLDGNGQISCGLLKYGFPGEMLMDCVQ